MLIGICGKSGSGKSSIANQIANNHKNVVHLDIDTIAHKSHQDEFVKKELVETYGLTNNQIDRKKLGKVVFSSREEMEKLKKITWNFMEKEIDNFIFQNKDKIIILDYILLPLTSVIFTKTFNFNNDILILH